MQTIENAREGELVLRLNREQAEGLARLLETAGRKAENGPGWAAIAAPVRGLALVIRGILAGVKP